MTRWAGRLALLVGACVASIVLAEVIARVHAGRGDDWLLVQSVRWYDDSVFQKDAELGQVLRPGAVVELSTPEFSARTEVNSLGLRGPELGEKTRPRLLTVGDSFTLAMQVDRADTFQERLSHALDVEVLNAGVDGFGTEHERRLAARLSHLTDSDAVLMVLFLGNDLRDNQSFRPQGYPTAERDLPSLLSARDQRWGWSALYFHYVSWQRRQVIQRDRGAVEALRNELQIFLAGRDIQRHLGPTQMALEAFAADCRVRDQPCFVAVAPPSFVLDADRLQATMDTYGIEGTPDVDAAAAAVLAALPAGLSGLDLTPALRTAAADEAVFLQFDGHWTPAGHRAVAEAVADHLNGAGWPPRR